MVHSRRGYSSLCLSRQRSSGRATQTPIRPRAKRTTPCRSWRASRSAYCTSALPPCSCWAWPCRARSCQA